MDKNNELARKTKELIESLVRPYKGMEQEKLKIKLQVFSNAKNVNRMIIDRIVNVAGLDLEIQFYIRDYTTFKTVVIQENGRVRESMSFPAMDYFDIKSNDWQNSQTYKMFAERTFYLFVFKRVNDEIFFEDVVFFDLSIEELYQIFIVWEKVKTLIVNDRVLLRERGASFSVDNFPTKAENDVAHIRPHDTNLEEGKNLLPNGKQTGNYCFWLNNTFIENKIKERIKL